MTRVTRAGVRHQVHRAGGAAAGGAGARRGDGGHQHLQICARTQELLMPINANVYYYHVNTNTKSTNKSITFKRVVMLTP